MTWLASVTTCTPTTLARATCEVNSLPGAATSFVRESEPLWHRAIRLLGLQLLEADPEHPEEGTRNWTALRELLGAPPSRPEVASDLLLEAVPFAVEPERLLDNLAPDMFADDGALLRRFLVRFLFRRLHPASPGPRFTCRCVARNASASRGQISAAKLPALGAGVAMGHPARCPSHRAGRGRAASHRRTVDAGNAQLRDVPAPIETRGARAGPRGGSGNTAPLATAGRGHGTAVPARARLWSRAPGALSSRDTTPRGPHQAGSYPSPEATEVAPEQQYLLRRFVRGEPVGPWPGGPVADSDDEFAKVALVNPGAGWLVEFDPSFAREVFVALLIEPPHERDPMGGLHDRELRIRHPELGFEPTHLFPPVRELLLRAPETGMAMVVQLADFATERWVELMRLRGQLAPDDHEHDGIDVKLSDGVRHFLGAGNPFLWHLAGSNGPKPVTACLMTLEHWLYEQQDAQTLDAGTLGALLNSTYSVAMLGLLCEIALRAPGLLLDALEPLVTSAELLYWSRSRGMLLRPHASQVSRESRDFVGMDHRARDLVRVIVYVFAQTGLEWPAITSSSEQWRSMLTTLPPCGFRNFLEQLVSQFDRRYWTVTPTPDGQAEIAFNPSPEMAARHEEGQKALRSLEVQMLPYRCKRILDGEEPLSDDDALGMLERVRDVGHLDEDASWAVGGISGLRCAVAATVLLRAPGWITDHAEWREICADWVLTAVEAELDPEEHHNRVDARDWTWDVFAARALPGLLAENESDRRLRRAVARMVAFPHDAAVVQLFAYAFEELSTATFDALIHLGVIFAREHARLYYRAYARPRSAESGALNDASESFIDGTLRALPSDWSDHATANDEEYAADEDYLIRMFAWVSRKLGQGAERERIAAVVDALVKVVQNRIRRMDDGADARSAARARHRDDVPGPQQSDWTLLEWVARLIVTEPSKARRYSLWAPWVSLSTSFHYWLETFFEDIYRAGLDEAAPYFKEALSEIISYLMTEGWLKRSGSGFWVSGPALRLIGRGHTMHVIDRWTASARTLRSRWPHCGRRGSTRRIPGMGALRRSATFCAPPPSRGYASRAFAGSESSSSRSRCATRRPRRRWSNFSIRSSTTRRVA